MTKGKTAVDLYSIPDLGDFLQERMRVTIRDKKRRQALLLLRDNRGFCYETFGALVEALDNTAFY